MSRSNKSRHGDQLAPALFPFLAVLLCTMGALVLILVLVVSQASAAIKTTLEDGKEKLLEVSDVVEVVSDDMLARREQQQKAIDNRRSQLAAIEDHIDRLVKELADLERVSQAIKDQANGTNQQRQAQLDRMSLLEQQIKLTEEDLNAKRAELAAKPPAFAIIPYQGKNGTTRRPIYLECTARGVTIQPEGVTIAIEDLKPPHGPGNPLDASLRVIRSAFQRMDPSASSMVSPYPLLLVRPDGIKAYVLARAAMSGWDDQFGYELIDQTMPLAFPPSIPGLAPQLASNLEVARQRQSALIAAMPRRYGSENVWADALEEFDADQSEAVSASQTNRNGNSENDWSSIDESPSPAGSSNWKMVEEYSALGGSSGSQTASQNSNSKVPTGGLPNSTQMLSRTDAKLAASSTTQWERAPGDVLEIPSTGSSRGNSLDAVTIPNSSTALGTSENSASKQMSALSQPPASSDLSGSSIPQSVSAGDQRNPSTTQVSQSTVANDPTNRSQATAGESQSGSSTPTLDLSPSKPSSQKEAGTPSVAQSRNWTSRRRITNGTAISRPIHVVVMQDRWFVMKDDRTDQVERVITLQSGPSFARQSLETAINDRMDTWGVAVAGGHWEPKLQVQVAPQAELSAERFRKIIDESGLEIEWAALK